MVLGTFEEAPTVFVHFHYLHVFVQVVLVHILHAQLRHPLIQRLNLIRQPLTLPLPLSLPRLAFPTLEIPQRKALLHNNGLLLQTAMQLSDQFLSNLRREQIAMPIFEIFVMERLIDILQLEH